MHAISGKVRYLVTGNSEARLRAIETQLGVEFPDDYASFVRSADGLERRFGDAYLALWDLEDLVPRNVEYEMSEMFPGLVLIGSDGGGEAVGFDFRNRPPVVVLVNFVSSGWREAVVQAATFGEFMAQRDAGLPYRFQA